MVGTDDLRRLLSATTNARVKTVLVGDACQLAPVKARGGMFEQLCSDLPWAQHLSEVWRMHDPGERAASLALRDGDTAALRRAVRFYQRQDRLRCGDQISMATDALAAYRTDIAAGKDALLVCDTNEMADALNQRLHHDAIRADADTVAVSRGQRVAVGDLILTRRNDPTIPMRNVENPTVEPTMVRNGNRWRVAVINPANGRIGAQRLDDDTAAVFPADYVREHVTLGYASTVHSKQGVTADRSHAILGEGATRSMAYVAMTRGRESNDTYIYQRLTGESDHEHSRPITAPEIHQLRRGNKYSAAHYFRMILVNDDRPRTTHDQAERAARHLLPDKVAELLDQNDARRTARRAVWREHTAAARARQAAYERMAQAASACAERGIDRDAGLEL